MFFNKRGFLLLLLIIIAGCSKKIEPDLLSSFYGVWVNKDCQLIRTEKYSLFFERNEKIISVNFDMITIKNKKLQFKPLAKFIFDDKKQISLYKAIDPVTLDTLVNNDKKNKLNLDVKSYKIKEVQKNKKPVRVQFRFGIKTVEELDLVDNTLKVRSSTGEWQILHQVEQINIADSVEYEFANKSNLSKCMKQWLLGAKMQRQRKQVAFSLNSNNISCQIYYGKFNNNSIIHARSARIGISENGYVMDQNIRLMDNPLEFSTWMVSDNFRTTNRYLDVRSELFDKDALNASENGLYLKVKSYNKNSIELWSNSGKKFIIKRPHKNNKAIGELFEFIQ